MQAYRSIESSNLSMPEPLSSTNSAYEFRYCLVYLHIHEYETITSNATKRYTISNDRLASSITSERLPKNHTKNIHTIAINASHANYIHIR